MAQYNTFTVQFTKSGRILLVTSSARKARLMLSPGLRVEVWSENRKIETVHTRTAERLDTYMAAERAYIRAKQTAAEKRNHQRRTRR